MVRDPALAEDLAQDTFVKVFTHLAAYDARYRFTSWILKIAHNTAIDYLRRPRVVMPLAESEDGETLDSLAPATSETDPAMAAEHQDLARALDKAIDRLRPEYREVVVLRYQEELGYEEIAELLALPLGTVKSYLHRARAELAGLMRAAGWGPSGPAPGGSATSNRGRP
jgi:RNA polymerase sigma-70 factor (ECF subfamily)